MDEKEPKELLVGGLRSLKTEVIKCHKDNEKQMRDREIIKGLKKDYFDFFKWALDLDEEESILHHEIAKKWKELHPNLPVPRAALLEQENAPYGQMIFIMDAYPLYLKYKEWDAAGLPI